MVSITQYFHKNYYLTALIIIFGVLFLIFITSGTLFTGYHFIDEHVMITTNHDLQNKNFFEELFKATIGEFHGGTEGRFRPFYVFQLYLESKLFGINRFLWSFYTGILIVITTFFIFIFAKIINFSFKEALFFAFLSVLGFQLEVGFHLFDNETGGMFWLSVTLIFTVLSVKTSKYRVICELLFIASTLLMSLSKESFILLIPAIAFIKVWQYHNFHACLWRQSIKNNALSLLVILLILLSELLYIKYFIGTTNGYAGVTGFNFHSILRSASNLTYLGFKWIIIFALTLMILVNRHNNLNFKGLLNILFSPTFILFILIVLPQVLLYAKSGFTARYLVPGMLGYSFLLVQMYRNINNKSRVLGKILSFLIVLCLILKFYDTWRIAHDFTIEGNRTNALLNLVEKNTVISDPILIVSNPFVYYEWTDSIGFYLHYLEKRNNLYLVTYGSQRSDFITNSMKKAEEDWIFLNPEIIKKSYKSLGNIKEKELIRCIIVPPKLKHEFLISSSDWFQIQDFNEYTFDLTSSTDWLKVKYEDFKGNIKKHFLHINNNNSDLVTSGEETYYVYLKK